MASSGILTNDFFARCFSSLTHYMCIFHPGKVVPEEVFPGQVAMVLLVQTGEPSIQTLNLINCHASSRVQLKLGRWVLNVRFPKISVLKFFSLLVSVLAGDDGTDVDEENIVRVWSHFTSVLTAFWSEA